MLVRRRAVRRLVLALALASSCSSAPTGSSSGVHNVSDVIAGYLLGAGIVLLWLALYDPTPRSIALVNEPLTEAVPNARKKLAVILNPIKVDDPGQFRSSSRTWRRTQASPRSSGGRPPSRTPATAWRTRPR